MSTRSFKRITSLALAAIVALIAFWIVMSLLVVFNVARAEGFYGIVGGGQSRLHHIGQNGLWVQENWGYVHISEQSTFTLGVGYQATDRVRLEADWRDLGSFNGLVRYVSDANYNTHSGGCNGPCEPTQTSMVHSDAKGVGLSATWDVIEGRTAPFIRAGVFAYTSRTEVFRVLKPTEPMDRSIDSWRADRSFLATPMLGAGLRSGPFAVEYTWFYKVGGAHAPMKRADTLTAVYRLTF